MQAKIIRFIGSRACLYGIVGLFALQALWLALTNRYPMAFDENFHFGLIQIYAHHWLPFLAQQPPDASVYGAVARDPSYLYHFLMSFPYRLLALATDNQTVQVLALRVINVALAAASLFIYADVLRRTPISAAYRNAGLFFFTVIPVLPLLAAQINYDNLLLLLVALVVRQTLVFHERLHAGVFNLPILAGIVILLGAASLVKYPFLPIGVAIVLFLMFQITGFIRSHANAWGEMRHEVASYKRLTLGACAVGVIIIGMLFVQRYGVNLVRYHALVPDCAQVLTIDECKQYAPWGRDYQFAAWNAGAPRDGIIPYAHVWTKQLMKEFFFGVYSQFRTDGTVVDYWGSAPVRTLIDLGWFTLVVGTAGIVVYIRRLWRRPAFRLFLLMTGIYVAALFYQNYTMYQETGVAVAIHGRYILPIVPFVLALYGFCLRQALADLAAHLKPVGRYLLTVQIGLAALLVLLCTQGGGFSTYILRSQDRFSWPQSQPARQLNAAAQRAFDTIIVE